MNKRKARASALDYVIRVAAAQDSLDAQAHYLGLTTPWQGEELHSDVAALDAAVGDVLDELRRKVANLKTRPARDSAAPNGGGS